MAAPYPQKSIEKKPFWGSLAQVFPAKSIRISAQTMLIAACLGLILLAGALLRFQGINWDSGQHLHPDERFLTMVETAIQWPKSIGQYFDSAHSPLNPYNRGFGTYVYGTFPLFLTHWIAQLVDQSGYEQVNLVGRALSAVMDLISVVLIFFIGRRLYGKRTGLLAAALLAFSVFNIQQSHFFTVDMPANVLIVLAAWFALRMVKDGGWGNVLGLGAAFGLALASKIDLALFGLVIAAACAMRYLGPSIRLDPAEDISQTAAQQKLPVWGYLSRLWQPTGRMALALAAVLGVSFLVFRVAQPYAFSGPGFFNIFPSAKWLADIQSVSRLISGQSDYPASDQWAFRTPYLFPWLNMVQWGFGWGLGLAAWLGVALATWELIVRRKSEHLLVVLWILAAFFTLGGGFVLTMRYFLPIYPFLALMAAYLLVWLWDHARTSTVIRDGARRRQMTALAGILMAGVLLSTVLWALAFTAVYRQPVSRVTASRWIYANIPPGSTYGWEHWDDPLPLRVDGKDPTSLYHSVELPMYAEDTPEKLYGDPGKPGSGLLDKLDQVDWIFVSSARLYDSIPRLPMRYPMTTRYYQALFDGELGFERVKTFTNFPSLFGRAIDDQGAEEQFTVYDHPQVDLFRKTTAYSRARAEKILSSVDWDSIQHITPLVAMRAPNGLMLTPSEQQAQQSGGTWSEIFNRDALPNRSDLAALITWLLELELFSLAVLPLTMLAFRGLSDRGYLLAKPLGFLLVGYLTWVVSSATPLPFTRQTILLCLGAIGLVGGLIWALQPDGLAGFFKSHRKLIVIEELVFLLFLLAFVQVRLANPDLWRPWTGGEKPMDFAFLNAVLKSTHFPPYDPWFSGGTMNYYYLGFVQVATLIKLTGIVPWVAYNLAIPSLFAMTAAGVFSVVFHFTQAGDRPAPFYRGVLFGLGGALLVTVLGNLGELKFLYQAVQQLGKTVYSAGPGALDGLRQAASGLWLWLNGQHLPVSLAEWYWNASRVMPGSEIEEFPFFTFLFGDLHAHMMALPLTVLAIGGAVNLLKLPQQPILPRSLARLEPALPILSILTLALVLGALKATNTWDYPTYLLLGFVAIGLWRIRSWGGPDLRGAGVGMLAFSLILHFCFGLSPEVSLALGVTLGGIFGLALGLQAVVGVLVLAFASLVLFLPFSLSYANAYTSIDLWSGDRTSLGDFLTIHGLFLFLIATILAVEWIGWLKHWEPQDETASATQHTVLQKRWGEMLLGANAVLLVTGLVGFGLKLPIAWISLPLTILCIPLLFRPGQDIHHRFGLFLILTGLLITMFVEVFVLQGDIGRSNTVFKFYLQVWVLWGIGAASSLPRVFSGLRSHSHGLYRVWVSGLVVLTAAAALYPLYAPRADALDRIVPTLPKTLNGMAFMQTGVYDEYDASKQIVHVELKYDRDALAWMQDQIDGSPVVAEANSPTLYHWTGRVSIWTGLPSILGYSWHETQQRAMMGSATVNQRAHDNDLLFSSTSSTEALAILRRYNVRYIYVGALERAFYPAAGIDKFAGMVGKNLELAYENPEVKIYLVVRTDP